MIIFHSTKRVGCKLVLQVVNHFVMHATQQNEIGECIQHTLGYPTVNLGPLMLSEAM